MPVPLISEVALMPELQRSGRRPWRPVILILLVAIAAGAIAAHWLLTNREMDPPPGGRLVRAAPRSGVYLQGGVGF